MYFLFCISYRKAYVITGCQHRRYDEMRWIKWFGHMKRKQEGGVVAVMHMEIDGTRKRGEMEKR